MAGARVLVMATAASANVGTIAQADQLNHLRQRVPLSFPGLAATRGG
jgi:hypothetical protein